MRVDAPKRLFARMPAKHLVCSDQNGQRLRDGQKAEEHEEFQLGVVVGGIYRVFVPAAEVFQAGKAYDQAEHLQVLNPLCIAAALWGT